MPQITLASMQDCITAAFSQYARVPSAAGPINVPTANVLLPVICNIDRDRFNCGMGFPPAPVGGIYTMPLNDADNLRAWCSAHPGGARSWTYGYLGPDATHPNQINITLIDFNSLMFNFHVRLS